MELPIINTSEIVPVRLIPFITIPKITSQRLVEILTGNRDTNGDDLQPREETFDNPTSMEEILSGDYEEDPYRDELPAYYLSDGKASEQITAYRWYDCGFRAKSATDSD